jgi:hypothetical protein
LIGMFVWNGMISLNKSRSQMDRERDGVT